MLYVSSGCRNCWSLTFRLFDCLGTKGIDFLAFGVYWVILTSVSKLLASWVSTSKAGRDLPQPPKKNNLEVERVLSILPCLMWFNWLERNKRVFECAKFRILLSCIYFLVSFFFSSFGIMLCNSHCTWVLPILCFLWYLKKKKKKFLQSFQFCFV